MKRFVRSTLWLLVALVGIGLVGAPAARAVQSSGSIQLIPSKQTGLVLNELITVDVYFTNTSSQTPPPPGPLAPALATLTGPITIDVGCIDCGCSQQNTTALSFIPGVQAGCTAKSAMVTGCAAGGAGEVLINLDAAGVNIPDATPVFLATITLRNNEVDLPILGLRAGTGICALKACITPPNDQCASCSAEGCTFVAGTSPVKDLLRCKHSCFNQVNFTNGFDAYIFQGVAVVDDPNFDPAAESFTLTLARVPGGQVFTISVPGGIPNTGVNVWTLTGPGNQNTAGIDLIKITRQTGVGCQNSFRLQVKFFGDFNVLQGVDTPTLRTEITFDGRPPFVNEEPWTRLQNGNLRNDIDLISSC